MKPLQPISTARVSNIANQLYKSEKFSVSLTAKEKPIQLRQKV
jgi:hypothetical protein